LNINGNINFVATDGDKIIALVNASTLSYYEHYKELGYADLLAIYISPEYQRLGLGRRLFDMAVSELKRQGCTKMVIGVLNLHSHS
jgi:ribosomal protein S18 acetylase RimI-like enzyme